MECVVTKKKIINTPTRERIIRIQFMSSEFTDTAI
ncbi:Uncharacterised protein [Legionella sainthelensi]|nr:Uncharacterised protein [Legionella sainthelensi]